MRSSSSTSRQAWSCIRPPATPSGTLVNALIAHCGDSLSGIGGVKRPGIVHRLDKDTTGLMVVAKTDKAHRALSKQFAEQGRKGRSSAAISPWSGARPTARRARSTPRSTATLTRATSRPCAKAAAPAVTHWQVLERFPGPDGKPVASLLACTLETGRTHQIRVHLAHIGHPILGDATYGTGFKTKASRLGPQARAALEALGRQALHAYLLAIEHPETGRKPGVPIGTAGRSASFTCMPCTWRAVKRGPEQRK